MFLTGTTGYGPPNYGDFTTFSFAASDGALQWTSRWDDGGTNSDWPTALAVAPTGSELVVTGGSWSTYTDAEFATVAYSI